MIVSLDEFRAAVDRYATSSNTNPLSPFGCCLYVGEGESGGYCLLGQIYLDLGGSEEVLRAADNSVDGVRASDLFSLGRLANSLQSCADKKGVTWAEAIQQWKMRHG